MVKKPAAKASEPSGQDTITAPTNMDDPNLFNGADPALFDHDGDGHAGGSLPQDDPQPEGDPGLPPEQPAEELPVGVPSELDESPMNYPPPQPPIGVPTNTVEQPTVGRIVHFFENSAQEQPLAAMVNSVDPEFGIKVTIFRPNMTVPLTGFVPHLNDLDTDGPCWVWPLYSSGYAPSIANVGSLADKFPGATGATVFGQPK